MQLLPTRDDLSRLDASVQYTSLLRPHFIASQSSCTQHEFCECPVKLVCPLCPVEISDSLHAMEHHYETVHWDHKVSVSGTPFTVFPCGESHQSESARRRTIMPSVIPRDPVIHYHCPYCVFRCPMSEILLLEHVASVHPAGEHSVPYRRSESGKVTAETETVTIPLVDKDKPMSSRPESPTSPSSKKKVHFQDHVKCRYFPLALSIVDQLGGMKESKKDKFSMEEYVSFSTIGQFAFDPIFANSTTRLGCDQPVYRLFKGLKFLICGTNIPLSVLSAITALKGEVSGARYDDSQEWPNLTHVILGTQIAPKSIREIRKLVPLDVLWVTGDWVRSCVENGSVFYNQPNISHYVFSPAAIERYFMIQQAAVRMERRKSMRAKPDIPTATTTHHVSFIGKDDIVNMSISISNSATSTPRLSPVIQEDTLMTTPPDATLKKPSSNHSSIHSSPNRRSRGNSSGHVSPTGLSPAFVSPIHENLSPQPRGREPSIDTHNTEHPKRRESIEGRHKQTAAPIIETLMDIRRSKRLSMAPAKFSYTHHHSIKKP